MEFAGIDFAHTSNLPQGRAKWLRRQIDNPELGAAVTVDSDTWWTDPYAMIAAIREVARGSHAIGIAPVNEGGSKRMNLRRWTTEDEFRGTEMIVRSRARPLEGERRPLAPMAWIELLHRRDDADHDPEGAWGIAAGGFGVAIHRLSWYRQAWRDPAPDVMTIDSGEDMEHCLAVQRRGGRIRWVDVPTQHAEWQP